MAWNTSSLFVGGRRGDKQHDAKELPDPAGVFTIDVDFG